MESQPANNVARTTIPYSKIRIAGMGLYWSWVFIMFNSIQPYAYLTDKRSALYLGLLLSLLSAAVMLAFLALESKGNDSLRHNKPVLWGSVLAMSVGALLTPFSDTGSSTGMLILGISAIMTGSGSAALLITWFEAQAPLGGRATLCELSAAFFGAFVLSLVLALVPPIIAICATVLLPGASLALLLKSPANHFRPKTIGTNTADSSNETQFPPVALSRETKWFLPKGW